MQQYSILRLNLHSDASWAVIELPSGKIVSDADGSLFLRMTRKEATDAARSLADASSIAHKTMLAGVANKLPI